MTAGVHLLPIGGAGGGGVTDHFLLTNIGVNTHVQIDAHIADGTIHFTQASLDATYLRLDTANDPLTSDLTVQGLVQAERTISGDPGVEGTGITVNGTLYESSAKVSDIGGVNVAQFILHRHSTTLQPLIIGARTASNTAAHTIVADNDVLLSMFAAGWDGADYALAAEIRVDVDGTPGIDDMPGQINFLVSPIGSQVPVSAMRIRQDGSIEIDSTLDGRDIALDGTTQDNHIADGTIHFADAPADAQNYFRNNNAWVVAPAGVTDHTLLTNIGVNTHIQLDTHLADGTIHFTEASIDHLNIGSIGVNSHAVIDTHIADGTIHYADAPADGLDYVRNNNAWIEDSNGGGLISGQFRFNSSIVAADPGNGRFRLNNAAYAAVTEVFIDIVTDDIGTDVTNFLSLLDAGDRLYFQNKKDAGDWVIYDVTGPAVDNTGWFTIPVSIDRAGALFSNNDRCVMVVGYGGDTDSLYLRLDTANDPLTGALTTQQIEADTNQTRDLGTSGPTGRFNQMRGRLLNGLGQSATNGNVDTPAAIITYANAPTGIAAGNVVQGGGAGITSFRHGASTSGGPSQPFKAVATIANAFASGAGSATVSNNGGGSFLGGSAYTFGSGSILLASTNFGNFTWAYAYTGGTNPHTFRNGAGGAFLGGYSQGNAAVTVENFSQGPGCFTWVRPTGGNAASIINVFNRGDGAFLQGAPVGADGVTTRMEITTTGNAGFLQGRAQGAATMLVSGTGGFCQGFANGANMTASGGGSFAHGQASAGNAITASGVGSFAVGDSAAGAITASALNSTQFGPGVNALANSLQVGTAGIRFKGTAGAPAAPQNGDFWVAGAYVYVRSNGVSIQIAGPGPLTN